MKVEAHLLYTWYSTAGRFKLPVGLSVLPLQAPRTSMPTPVSMKVILAFCLFFVWPDIPTKPKYDFKT